VKEGRVQPGNSILGGRDGGCLPGRRVLKPSCCPDGNAMDVVLYWSVGVGVRTKGS
jgi:hypothetical protein